MTGATPPARSPSATARPIATTRSGRLEKDRLPKYLEARLPAKPNVSGSGSGHQTWRLEVRVRPGEARGQFPRQEDPAYADSAVYVQIVGKTPRSIRVPVSGTANDE